MKNTKISILGLGYVGLPLALEFSKKFDVVGFDINKKRVDSLKKKNDKTKEVSKLTLLRSKNLFLTTRITDMEGSNFFIITVPTPINSKNKPNLKPLEDASHIVGKVIKKKAIVIVESTVYPGVTENNVAKIISKTSGLVYKKDFNMAYSPERINPGDKIHSLSKIQKIIAGDTELTLKKVNNVYSKIIKAGLHKVSTIKAAETSKAIENAQRDINIAFINEVVMICKAIGVDSNEVIKAAKTKWNFLNFVPGLVGGHCIGVDPFYLAEAAIKAGHNPEIILAGRKINDGMPKFIFKEIKKITNSKDRILILGVSFKENVNDIRNSKSVNLFKLFKKAGYETDIYDPIVSKSDIKKIYNINMSKPKKKYDVVINTVAHSVFSKMSENDVNKFFSKPSFLLDIKNVWKNKKLPKYVKRWEL